MSRAQPWEVWLVDFGEPVGSEQGGRGPSVVVASDFHATFPIPITLVVPLTTKYRSLPHHIRIDLGRSGVREVCFAKTEEITAVSERRLVGRQPIGTVEPAVAEQIRAMVRRMIV